MHIDWTSIVELVIDFLDSGYVAHDLLCKKGYYDLCGSLCSRSMEAARQLSTQGTIASSAQAARPDADSVLNHTSETEAIARGRRPTCSSRHSH